jgi:hypothetical protein
LPDTVSYDRDIQPIFYLYCAMAGCHSGNNPSGKVDLSYGSSYNALFQRRLIDTVNPANSGLINSFNRPMPPWGKLTNYYYLVTEKWMQQGAKNN